MPSDSENRYGLVGDVGGTNVRLALCELRTGALSQLKSWRGQDFPGLQAVVGHYLAQCGQPVSRACVAIACPINDDQVTMTNHSWRFSIEQTRQALGFEQLEVINDFTAIAMAVPTLSGEHLCQLGGGAAQPGKPVAVFGAGTGLGVAHLVCVDQRWISLPGEGGHVDFAPGSDDEIAILQQLFASQGHISAERLLSGPGLVNLYQALVQVAGRVPEVLVPQQITERALTRRCADCQQALSLFCRMLGRFGGNLALTLGTFGGVYIAGGLVTHFVDFFRASAFREGFEDKGRFKAYLQPVPAYLITHPQPGLLGAGAHLRQTMGMIL